MSNETQQPSITICRKCPKTKELIPLTEEEIVAYENKEKEFRKTHTIYVESFSVSAKELKKLKIKRYYKQYSNEEYDYYYEFYLTPEQYTLFALQDIDHMSYDHKNTEHNRGREHIILRGLY